MKVSQHTLWVIGGNTPSDKKGEFSLTPREGPAQPDARQRLERQGGAKGAAPPKHALPPQERKRGV